MKPTNSAPQSADAEPTPNPRSTRSTAARRRWRFAMLAAAAMAIGSLGQAQVAAAGDNQDKFLLSADVVLEGVMLPAGGYKVEWKGEGEGVEVLIKKGNRVVVTAQGTRKDLGRKATSDSASIEPVENGTPVLVGMKFGGSTYEIRFAQASAQKKSPGDPAVPVKRASSSAR